MSIEFEIGKKLIGEAEDARKLNSLRVSKDKYTLALESFTSIIEKKPHILASRQAKQHVWERISTLYSELQSCQLPPVFEVETENKSKPSKLTILNAWFRDVFLDRLWKTQFNKRFGGPKPSTVSWKDYYLSVETDLNHCKTLESKLFWSIRHRHKKWFRHLVELDPNADLNITDEDSNTLIHWAVNVDDVDTVRLLLERGVKHQSSGANGWSPLHLAIYRKNRAIFELLIESNPRLNAKDEYGNTLLHTAVHSGDPYFVQRLMDLECDQTKKNKAGNTPLYIAVATGQDDLVDFLLSKSPDLTEVTPLKWTLIHTAAALGHPYIVNALLSAGAPVNALDCFNRTALHWALQLGRLECANILLDANVDVTVKDQFKEDALSIAASLSFSRMVAQITQKLN